MSCFYLRNIFSLFISITHVVILILVSQRAEVQVVLLLGTEKMKQAMLEAMKKQRGNPPTPLELLLVLYVFGFIWEETQEIFSEGIRSYLRNMWNFIDFSRNSLYCFVFLLRSVAFFQQMNQISKDPTTAFIPREHWDDFDPQLIVIITKNSFFFIKKYRISGRRSFCSCKRFLSSQIDSFVLNQSSFGTASDLSRTYGYRYRKISNYLHISVVCICMW